MGNLGRRKAGTRVSVDAGARAAVGKVGRGRKRGADVGADDNRGNLGTAARPRSLKAGITEGKYGDGEIWGFTFIAGPTGSGKSWEADRLVSRCKRVLKFIPPAVTFERRGWPVFTQPGQLRRFLAAHPRGTSFQVIYCPMHSGLLEEHFEHVGRLCLALGNMVLYVDEIDMLCSPASLTPYKSAYYGHPDRKFLQPVLGEIINRGRHRGIAMVAISRRPAQVNRALTQNCSEMRLFRQNEPNVLAYFRAVSQNAADMLPRLNDFEYVLFQDGKESAVYGGRR